MTYETIVGYYGEVRDALKDGQIVFFEGNNWFQKIIKFFTRGQFTHCGILVWMTDDNGDKKLMCVESTEGGARLVTLRSYVPRGFHVVDVGFSWTTYGSGIINRTGVQHYSYINFILIGIKETLANLGLTALAHRMKHKGSGEVCSEFIADELRTSATINDDIAISPNALYAKLLVLDRTTKVTIITAQADIQNL